MIARLLLILFVATTFVGTAEAQTCLDAADQEVRCTSDRAVNCTDAADRPIDCPNAGNGGQGASPQGETVTINNPLAANSITEFFFLIIEILLIFAIPIIVLFIILAGFKFVTAQGNESQIGDAKRALLYAIVGGLLILGAFLILEVIQGTVASFQANP